jgi:hypothetical protein
MDEIPLSDGGAGVGSWGPHSGRGVLVEGVNLRQVERGKKWVMGLRPKPHFHGRKSFCRGLWSVSEIHALIIAPVLF